ncbi:MAG: MgtC/SapB family protein [Gemmatimonadetes bacterium]|nr:MgtC/SapB family protein [Gemmatimonadota bacterium]
MLEPLVIPASDGLQAALRLGIAGLVGVAAGIEREWSGHATGPAARFAGMRTFLILGLCGGVAGVLAAAELSGLGAVILLGGVGLVIAAYVLAMRNPEADADGTTEAAALVILALGLLAGIGQLALASGAGALVVLVLGEKRRLHGMVAKVGEAELQAAARFAVMALVILPILPTTPLPFGGDISARGLWTLVLLFSGINFAGYLARRAVGPERGYGLAGLLGGFISSTLVTMQFARRSRVEPTHAGALALGVIAACTVLPVRLLAILGVLAPTVGKAALPYLIPPAVVGAVIVAVAFRRTKGGGEAAEDDTSPLHVAASVRMAVLFWLALIGIEILQRQWGSTGIYTSAVLLGLTDMDALTVAMARLGGAPTMASVAATGVAIGVLSNTAFKLGLGVVLGSPAFRARLGMGLLALGAAVGLGWLV